MAFQRFFQRHDPPKSMGTLGDAAIVLEVVINTDLFPIKKQQKAGFVQLTKPKLA
jgi:hypothetical protein